jgi:hypothetical protein
MLFNERLILVDELTNRVAAIKYASNAANHSHSASDTQAVLPL